MTMLPAQPLPDLATREDMTGLRAEMQAEFGSVRAEMQGGIGMLRSEMHAMFGALESQINARSEVVDAKFEAVDAKFHARFDAVDAKFEAVDARFGELRTELSAELTNQLGDFRKEMFHWLIALTTLMIVMFGALAGLGFFS